MKTYIKYCICLLAAFFVVTGCTDHSNEKVNKNQKQDISYEIVASEYGYGYKIYVDGKLYINQPNIPALPGMAGFVTASDASKVAEIAVTKIKQGIRPPTITVKELKSAGITVE